ncbi:MAG: hypothetical protein HQM13_06525 [SAR324 cluster bacterium]|nr:hypothetical protein [SAR324 cluster bacterium]
MKPVFVTLLLFSLLSGFSVRAEADVCQPEEGKLIAELKSDRYRIAVSSLSGSVRVGKPFSVTAVVCDQKGAPADVNFRMDAWMPQHNHGMNYRPAVTRKSTGHFLVEGLMMHMPGMWQFTFKIGEGSDLLRLSSDFVLEK